MKVFISSVISGFEAFREAASGAVIALGYEVVRAEDFSASANSPQQACLAGVRDADLTIALLGPRYGVKQASGLSATHEEFREARARQPVLAFVQADVGYEPDQAAFIEEVRRWETGALTTDFATQDDLRDAVARGLHQHAVSGATRPLDERELLARAKEVIGESNAFQHEPRLVVGLAPGPRQEVLRPGQLEDAAFAQELQQQSLFGPHAPFAVAAGTQTGLRGDWLVLSQESRSIEINAAGDIVIRLDASSRDGSRFPALIEEAIEEKLVIALGFAAAVLERIDSVQRLSRVAIAAAVVDATYLPWRTRAERDSSSYSVPFGRSHERVVAHLNPGVRARSEIGQRADELAHDLMVLLRRRLRG